MKEIWTTVVAIGGGFLAFIGGLGAIFLLMDRLWKAGVVMAVGAAGVVVAIVGEARRKKASRKKIEEKRELS